MADDDKLKTALVNANDLDRNDLIIKSMADNPLVKEEYKGMLKNISTNLPAIKKSSSNFYKSHSQFMGVMLDVTAITPIRSIKHTLAELDKTRMALEEAHLKMMKKDIELRAKEKKLDDGDFKDDFDNGKLRGIVRTRGENVSKDVKDLVYQRAIMDSESDSIEELYNSIDTKVNEVIHTKTPQAKGGTPTLDNLGLGDVSTNRRQQDKH